MLNDKMVCAIKCHQGQTGTIRAPLPTTHRRIDRVLLGGSEWQQRQQQFPYTLILAEGTHHLHTCEVAVAIACDGGTQQASRPLPGESVWLLSRPWLYPAPSPSVAIAIRASPTLPAPVFDPKGEHHP